MAGVRDLGNGISALQTTIEAVAADARQGALASLEATLSATPGTVTTITLPDWAAGLRLFPVAQPVRFAIGENPAAVGASSATTIAASAFAAGGIALADSWETRTLDPGTNRTLRLRATVASVVVRIEVW